MGRKLGGLLFTTGLHHFCFLIFIMCVQLLLLDTDAMFQTIILSSKRITSSTEKINLYKPVDDKVYHCKESYLKHEYICSTYCWCT